MSRLGEVLIGLKRNSAMSIASVILIFLTLLVLGFSIIIMANIDDLSSKIIGNLKVVVYINPLASEDEEQDLFSKVQNTEGVGTAEFSSKEQELDSTLDSMEDSFEPGEIQSLKETFSGDENPLGSVITVKTGNDQVNIEQLTNTISKYDNVDKATFGDESVTKLINVLKKANITTGVICIILAVITIFLITNTIKLTINSRRKEIEIMRLVGATKWYIMFPFSVEGMILGLVGGILALFITYFGYEYAETFAILKDFLVPAKDIRGILILSQVILGMFIGLFGSLIAIRSYLRV